MKKKVLVGNDYRIRHIPSVQVLTGMSRKVIVTAFDWGGVIAFRLASEAPQIADRFIIVNAALVRDRCPDYTLAH